MLTVIFSSNSGNLTFHFFAMSEVLVGDFSHSHVANN